MVVVVVQERESDILLRERRDGERERENQERASEREVKDVTY